jgi:hypothetical protein
MDLQSLGHAAATFQTDPRIIRVALKAVQGKSEPEPALILNGLKYFKADEIVEAIKWIAEHDARDNLRKAKEAAGNG